MTATTKTIKLKEACAREGCGAGLIAIPGPHGRHGQHFARVECEGCGKFVRWSKWPDSPAHLLVLDGADRCRSCEHPILWRTTAKGKPIPLHLDGGPRVVIDAEGVCHVGWEAHHAKCPARDRWQKARQGGRR